MLREVMDSVSKEELNLPVPKAVYENVVADPSDEQLEMNKELVQRAEEVRKGTVDPSEDNMLLITTDGRKYSIDARIINPALPDFENSIANKSVKNIFNIWQRTSDKRSTQLVFSDISTPSADKSKFCLYDDIRNKLIAKGIPSEEIAYIHNYNTDTQKTALFNAVRQGKIRILFGSTEKMGAGTNVQDKLIALHHLDCPWRPSDFEQREGRIIRQGNENPEVYIFRYVTQNTPIATAYQSVQIKAGFINRIMDASSDIPTEAEDISGNVLDYATVKMLTTGNPLLQEQMDLDIKETLI